ncbi:MAG: DUF6868 family protein [Planctomycetota bacterium]|jgi:hypothetical protein
MSLELVRAFFGWMSVINLGALLFVLVMATFARDLAYSIHNRLMPMSKETWTQSAYTVFGFYKTCAFVFSIIPYLALCIVGS